MEDDWIVPEEQDQEQAPPQQQQGDDDWVVPESEHPIKTFLREAARSVATLPPTIAGAGLGGAALSEFGPPGMIAGSLGGAVAGSIGGNAFLDYLMKHLGLREGPGFLSEQAEQAGREANPMASLAGGLAAAPIGFGAKLPAAMN